MNEIKSLIKMAKKYLKSAEILLNAGDYESSVSRVLRYGMLLKLSFLQKNYLSPLIEG